MGLSASPLCQGTDWIFHLIDLSYESWNLICLQCVQMTCNKCLEPTRQQRQHQHLIYLCRIIKGHTSLRSGNCRKCQGCGRGKCFVNAESLIPVNKILDHSEGNFTGLQCTNCRRWEVCSNCLVNKRLVSHASCDGRMKVWELILPKSSTITQQNITSRTEKIIRGVSKNPRYMIAAAMGALLGAAALENVIDDD